MLSSQNFGGFKFLSDNFSLISCVTGVFYINNIWNRFRALKWIVIIWKWRTKEILGVWFVSLRRKNDRISGRKVVTKHFMAVMRSILSNLKRSLVYKQLTLNLFFMMSHSIVNLNCWSVLFSFKGEPRKRYKLSTKK